MTNLFLGKSVSHIYMWLVYKATNKSLTASSSSSLTKCNYFLGCDDAIHSVPKKAETIHGLQEMHARSPPTTPRPRSNATTATTTSRSTPPSCIRPPQSSQILVRGDSRWASWKPPRPCAMPKRTISVVSVLTHPASGDKHNKNTTPPAKFVHSLRRQVAVCLK